YHDHVTASIVTPGVLEVWGSHTYATVGVYTITVLVEATDFGPALDSFNATLLGTATALVTQTAPGLLSAGQLRNEVDGAVWLPAGLGEVAANTGALGLTHDLD